MSIDRLMPSFSLLLALGAAASLSGGCAPGSTHRIAAANDADRFAYGVGFDIGRGVREGLDADGIAADAALIRRGFDDGLTGRTPGLPQAEMDRVLRAVHREMAERAARAQYDQDPEFRAVADRNAQASDAAIASFAAQPTARMLESGVYAIIHASGSGRTVGDDMTAIAHWQARTADGREFVAAENARLDPRDLLPIPGRTLQAMRVGDHWSIAFGSAQVYGLAGDPPTVGPNEAIFIDITVTGLVPQEDPR